MSEDEPKPKRKRGNPNLVPGVSGNPAGRPKGSKNRTTLLKQAIDGQLTEELSKDASDILQKTIELAKEGDTTCIKILMDRLMPIIRSDIGEEKGGVGKIEINVTSMPKQKEDGGLVIEAEEVDNEGE